MEAMWQYAAKAWPFETSCCEGFVQKSMSLHCLNRDHKVVAEEFSDVDALRRFPSLPWIILIACCSAHLQTFVMKKCCFPEIPAYNLMAILVCFDAGWIRRTSKWTLTSACGGLFRRSSELACIGEARDPTLAFFSAFSCARLAFKDFGMPSQPDTVEQPRLLPLRRARLCQRELHTVLPTSLLVHSSNRHGRLVWLKLASGNYAPM